MKRAYVDMLRRCKRGLGVDVKKTSIINIKPKNILNNKYIEAAKITATRNIINTTCTIVKNSLNESLNTPEMFSLSFIFIFVYLPLSVFRFLFQKM